MSDDVDEQDRQWAGHVASFQRVDRLVDDGGEDEREQDQHDNELDLHQQVGNDQHDEE